MTPEGKIAVVTGAASGIGLALAHRLKSAGARAVVCADRDADGAAEAARAVGGVAMTCDVGSEAGVRALVERVEDEVGPIDLFCSNAGVLVLDADVDNAASASDEAWDLAWRVHVMAHVWAARAVLPGMIARGGGYFLNTVSAAGLLNQIGAAPYSTTKHAAIGWAESLAITHRDHGIRVSVLCPQAVATAMLSPGDEASPAALDGIISAEAVAEAALEGLAAEQFLILPHPQVADYVRHKTDNYDRWLGGMAKLRRGFRPAPRS